MGCSAQINAILQPFLILLSLSGAEAFCSLRPPLLSTASRTSHFHKKAVLAFLQNGLITHSSTPLLPVAQKGRSCISSERPNTYNSFSFLQNSHHTFTFLQNSHHTFTFLQNIEHTLICIALSTHTHSGGGRSRDASGQSSIVG